MPFHNEILTVRATCLKLPAAGPDIEFSCISDNFRNYPPSKGFTGFKVNKNVYVNDSFFLAFIDDLQVRGKSRRQLPVVQPHVRHASAILR